MARLGLIGKAERIVHRGEPYLLVRLSVQDVRMVDLPDGRTDWHRLKDRGLAYLPLKIACDAMTLEVDGRRQRAHELSPCREETTVPAPFSVPLFVVFRYPKAGGYRIHIPATVLPPAAPVALRRMDPPPRSVVVPRSVEALLGARELVLQVMVPTPQPKPRF